MRLVALVTSLAHEVEHVEIDKVNPKTSALMVAAWNGHLNIVRYLVDHGAKLELRNYAQQTALHLSVIMREARCATFLASRGAEISAEIMAAAQRSGLIAQSLDNIRLQHMLADLGGAPIKLDPASITIDRRKRTGRWFIWDGV